MTTSQNGCRVCGVVAAHATFTAREMMFGSREEFEYFQCTSCECLQIRDIPKDLARFYPSEYYSLNHAKKAANAGTVLRWLQKQRCRTAIFGRGFKFNALLRRFVELPNELFEQAGGINTGDVLQRCNIQSFAARFLDVGCGSHSKWLADLSALGFRNLIGVDPFIDADQSEGCVRIHKREINAIEGKFDLITLNHSLEHMPKQVEVLHSVRERLTENGFCLVRIPLVSSYVWKKYGVNWVELDAPRHLYLHSTRSITDLGNRAGLELVNIVHDSKAFEFYGSEQYARDIPLTDERSVWFNRESKLFDSEEMEEFEAMASAVNADSCGGRAGLYFRRAD